MSFLRKIYFIFSILKCVGGILCAASFVISGILELELQKTYAVIPGESSSDVHLMNNIPCLVTVNINQGSTDITEGALRALTSRGRESRRGRQRKPAREQQRSSIKILLRVLPSYKVATIHKYIQQT